MIMIERVRQFILDVADPKSVREINRELARTSFEKLSAYYDDEKRRLGEYTLQHEIDRMRYTIVTPDVGILDDVKRIRKWASKGDRRLHKLWRYGNQSIFADITSSIQKILVLPHDPDSSLCVRVNNVVTTFTLNFKQNTIDAVCTFAIGTVLETTIGTIDGRVSIDLGHSVLKQKCNALRLEVIFDDKIEQVAHTLDLQRSKVPTKDETDDSKPLFGLKPPPDLVQMLGDGISRLDKLLVQDRSSETPPIKKSDAADALASIVRRGKQDSNEKDNHSNEDDLGDWGDWSIDEEEEEEENAVEKDTVEEPAAGTASVAATQRTANEGNEEPNLLAMGLRMFF